ncbi:MULTISPECIES: glycosyltransferase family 4 protein [Flavobacterium]|uniref:glycosyltransferase family 4 protein n=1 Tax=Flavobacterium TaxID=237 RepID=UPI001FCBBEF3|nr:MULTISPECIES: glycosyltransferase family 4 protein [Flavobacterium]UOK43801.1 glycosyltransferase family 4 protein [Flavobacterium enshiense]
MPLKSLLYLGNKLSGKGLNVTTVETLSAQLTEAGYNIVSASDKKNWFMRLADMLWAVVINRKTAFVLIDTYSTSGFWFAFFASQLCRILQIRYIPILHGGNLPNRLKNNPKLSAMVFENAYKNVAPSHYLYQAFKEFGFTNLLFIPNTVEIHKYSYKERKSVAPKLLWVRAFDAIYNPKMAVDVLCELQRKYSEAKLCMVGPDKDGSGVLTQEYARSLGLNIRFTGRLSKEEWIAMSKDYDIFINTTRFDNTPVSVMEAMALGLPVVSTNVGGIPFLLNDKEDALLVNDNDTEAMVNAVHYLIENHEIAQEIGVKARRKAEMWDWDVVKVSWNDLLNGG